jgi:hypothetical protein
LSTSRTSNTARRSAANALRSAVKGELTRRG